MMRQLSGTFLLLHHRFFLEDNMNLFETIAAGASVTPKPSNRDAVESFRNTKAGAVGVVVADGVGSTSGVDKLSRFAVREIKELAEQNIEIMPTPLELMEDCQSSAQKQFLERKGQNDFATTLIVVQEVKLEYGCILEMAYAGNGAIWHMKGCYNNQKFAQLFPWSGLNYLSPHCIDSNGQAKLYNSMTCSEEPKFCPQQISLSGDKEFGDLIIICSDGISSMDQAAVYEDGGGIYWRQIDGKLSGLLECLNSFFKESKYSSRLLEQYLENYLMKLKEENLLDDDATVGVIVTGIAQQYQYKINHGTPDSY